MTAPPFEYWGDPEKTGATRRDGAITFGDLGYLDRDGYLFIVGSRHDTIISGGVNVYPREVEDVLVTHPAGTEVAVYGADHPEWGQEVRALVVQAPGQPLEVRTAPQVGARTTRWVQVSAGDRDGRAISPHTDRQGRAPGSERNGL